MRKKCNVMRKRSVLLIIILIFINFIFIYLINLPKETIDNPKSFTLPDYDAIILEPEEIVEINSEINKEDYIKKPIKINQEEIMAVKTKKE